MNHDYYYVDGMLMYEKHGNEYELFYRYDNDGRPQIVMLHNSNETGFANYSVVTNSQGDIVKLLNGAGAVRVEYSYDAWGNATVVSDTSNRSLSTKNSLRYRGYVYDRETGLYYLQSRYYDPEVGRFINCDQPEYIGANDDFGGWNSFSYCENEPVDWVDPEGHVAITITVSAAAIGLAKIVIAGIAILGTYVILKQSGLLDKLIDSIIAYVNAIGSNAISAINALKAAINTTVEKAKSKTKNYKTAKHHIIAKSASKASRARYIWTKVCQFSINDNKNLVSINVNFHTSLHTNAYYEAVNTIVATAYNKRNKSSDVIVAVSLIKQFLATASYLSR